MKHKHTFWILICGILVVSCCVYYWYMQPSLVCVLSQKDGKQYCVRERHKVQKAANLLSDVANQMERMVEYMHDKHGHDPRVQTLVKRFSKTRIMETLPTSTLTAYSENKGQKIAMCLNRRKDRNEDLIDLHTLTFVALHELSHLMTDSIGHKQEFWENFKWLLENAKQAGIHQPKDYKHNPHPYCGMMINDNPYYDLT